MSHINYCEINVLFIYENSDFMQVITTKCQTSIGIVLF